MNKMNILLVSFFAITCLAQSCNDIRKFCGPPPSGTKCIDKENFWRRPEHQCDYT